jgi:chromosomal replication initiation ATPase DnaA
MSNVDDEVISVIKRLAKTIKKVGVKKVVAALDELNTEEGFIEAHKNLIKFVKKESATAFQVSVEDMERKNIRGVKVDARSMCFVLLKKHLDLNHKDIAALFGSKNHSIVSNALTEFNSLDYEIKRDRKFLETFQKLDKKVEEQKNILWVKHS